VVSIRQFPDHYTPVHDYINNHMNPILATVIFVLDIYFVLKTYGEWGGGF